MENHKIISGIIKDLILEKESFYETIRSNLFKYYDCFADSFVCVTMRKIKVEDLNSIINYYNTLIFKYINPKYNLYQWDEFINVQQVHKGDATAISNYTERYIYDEVGNITLQHHVGSTTWTRTFEYYSGTNRLAKSYTGSAPPSFSYPYDEHGNMLAMEHLDTMNWNVLDQLQSVVVSGSETAYYHYGADGQRKRKTITNSSSKKERFYLDATEIYTEVNSLNVVTFSRESLHIMDDTRRIVLVDFPASVGSTTMTVPLIRYQYSNHIESAALELDDSGNVISYEEPKRSGALEQPLKIKPCPRKILCFWRHFLLCYRKLNRSTLKKIPLFF